MPPQSNKNLYLLSGLILLGIVALLVITLYDKLNPNLPGNPIVSNRNDSFFDNMLASVTGEITKVKGNSVTIKNKNGLSRDFKVSKTVSITPNTGSFAAPSSDLNKIETDKQVAINFIFMEGELMVSSIFPVLLPPPLSSPPAGPSIQNSPPLPVGSGTSVPATPSGATSPEENP